MMAVLSALSNGSHGIHCISDRCTVEGNSVDFNGGHGIFIGASGQSLVTGNRVTSNTLNGLNAGTTTAYGGNVFTGNSAGDVSGGIEIGTNVCGTNTTCP